MGGIVVRGWKASVALLVVMSFLVPPVALAIPGESAHAAAGGRGEYDQNKEPPGKAMVNVTLSLIGSLYQNSSFNISLPNNATIISASVDLEGNPVMGATQSLTADFASDPGSMYTAYAGSYSKNSPGNAKPSTFQGSTLSGYDLSRIAYSDGSFSQMYAYGWNNEWAYHRFSFRVPLDVVSKVKATYEGFAGYSYYGYGTVAAYIWNNRTTSWDLFGTGSENPKSTFSQEFKGPDFLWGQGNYRYVDVLAICQVGTSVYGSMYNFINTDFVQIYVEGNVLTFPKNPKLHVGNAYTPGWSLQTDKFDYLVSVGEATLMNQIQDETRKAKTQNADVRFTFKSDTMGKIRITNFKISYTSPPWCKVVPDTFALDEDTPNPKFINLNDYFIDDVDSGKLKFDIIYEENPKLMDADITADGGWMGFKLPTKNWHGALRFQVRATDGDSLQRDSNKFVVTVLPMNDPPNISPIGRQLATEELKMFLTVRVKDVDMDLDPDETVILSDNTTLFEIEPTTGKIEYNPTQEQVGIYNIAIIATDLAGATDQENFTLEVLDAEDSPVLDDIPDQSAMQDTLFTTTVGATDPDLPYGDTLTFSDDSPLFAIDAASGAIGFTPSVKDIGTYKVTITVNDARGGTDSRQFTLSVLNAMGTLNRPPAIDPIPNQTAQEGTPFEYIAKGSDPDIDSGDSLSFQDNCNIFDIISGTGKISFKPTAKDAGTYNVKITVKDREGLTATTEFRLTVLKLNHAPNITEVLPKDGSKVLVGRQFKLSVVASDVDGDKLNYTWKDGDVVLGYGLNITASYEEAGTYIITIIVTDGKLERVNETTIEVVEKIGGGGSTSTPGFGTLLAVAAVAMAALGLGLRKRR